MKRELEVSLDGGHTYIKISHFCFRIWQNGRIEYVGSVDDQGVSCQDDPYADPQKTSFSLLS